MDLDGRRYLNDTENGSMLNLVNSLYSFADKDQLLSNLGLFLTSKNLGRILFFNHIYNQILNVPGQIVDFGTRWGNSMGLFVSLRGIYEPFNRHRVVVGFDTFDGFPDISPEDGNASFMKKGELHTGGDQHVRYLNNILEIHEQLNPLNHIKKFEVIKGDACETAKEYFDKNPHAIIALAYFDFDLYKPTKNCLQIIKDRIVKGSVLAFDELNDKDSPGETVALQETFGLNNITLKRLPYVSRTSYFVYGE